MRECPKILEYVRLGKCKKNAENKIVLPDGKYIPRYITGRNFVERIDNWHKANPLPAQETVAANLYERELPPHMMYMATSCAEIEEVEEEEELAGTLAYQEAGDVPLNELTNEDIEIFLETRKKQEKEKTKGKEKFDGVQMPARPGPAPKKKVVFVPEVPGNAGRLPPPEVVAIPPAPKTFVPKYRASIEEAVDAHAIVERALNPKFEITPKEFFAIYPEGRKIMKDMLTSKKIPNVEVVYSEHTNNQQYVLRYEEDNGSQREERLTSSDIDALRVIDPIINDALRVEAILDQGSEIIAMNKDIWQKLGVGLDPKRILNMQSANSQSNKTTGVISDLKLSLFGIDLTLQVHVVQGAPFDLLIGRPFFRYTSCQTYDNTDGTQMLTITCPNTGKVITIPTRTKSEKNRNPFRTEVTAAGFRGAGRL